MKEKIKKIITYFMLPFVLPVMVFGSILNISQKEKPKKEEVFDTKEQPHAVENRYSDPFQGRNLIEKSITTSASIVSAFEDFFNREI